MSRYCLVPKHWNVEQLQKHTCDDRSHAHISRVTRDELVRKNAAIWLITPAERAQMNGTLPAGSFEHGALQLKDTYALRGFSARYGLPNHWNDDLWRLFIAEVTRRPIEGLMQDEE